MLDKMHLGRIETAGVEMKLSDLNRALRLVPVVRLVIALLLLNLIGWPRLADGLLDAVHTLQAKFAAPIISAGDRNGLNPR